MPDYSLLWTVLAGVGLLLLLILYFKIHAFLALFICSMFVGLLAGMPPAQLVLHLQKGIGDTLGFVATIVGLGSIFGAILEESGGAHALARFLLVRTGENKAPWAMALTGFLISIPVFFDVAFIILVPVLYALQKSTGKSLLLFGIPLLAGLAVSHTFIPPTPGPVAVAEIMGADLGIVILAGIITGIPTVIVAGPVFGKFISKKIQGNPPFHTLEDKDIVRLPPPSLILFLIGLPIFMIMINLFVSSPLTSSLKISQETKEWIKLAGHPFVALIVANLVTWYFLGIRRGFSRQKLMEIAGDSLKPAGAIILITGAGGMFKQILTETGAGKMLAEAIGSMGISYLIFAFVIAALVRILQGSATVAMITSAGMTASVTMGLDMGELEKALVVISIASGATILSHVNDSGFWLVSRYFGLNEKQTFASWTLCTTIIAFTGLAMVLLIKAIVV